MVYPTTLPGRAVQQIDVRSRLAFHWRASDLSLKALTGQQGVFTRPSPGGLVLGRGNRSWLDSEGRMLTGPQSDDVPRFEMVQDASGLWVPALRLEGSRQNRVVDFDGSMTPANGATIGNNDTVDPRGLAKGHRITSAAGGVNEAGTIGSGGSVSAGSPFVVGGYAKLGTSAYVAVGDSADSVLHRIWVDATLAVTGSENVNGYHVAPAGNGWFFWWIYVAAASATHNPTIAGTPANASGIGTTTAGQYCWMADCFDEGGVRFASSTIPTSGSAVTRAAETLYFPFSVAPTAMSVYYRFREVGQLVAGAAEADLFSIGTGLATLRVRYPGAGAAYQLVYTSNTAQTPTLPSGPSAGQVVEHLITLDGSGQMVGTEVRDGGTHVTVSATAALPLPSAWGNARLYLGSFGGVSQSFVPFMEMKVALDVQSLQYMREVL